MLSRTADQLYWMARYVERAENMARILDVTYRMSLMPGGAREGTSIWLSALEISGQREHFESRHDTVSGPQVMRYLALDPDSPSSIYSSIRAARENARALRSSITTEMWESLNGTWLELRDTDAETFDIGGYRNFFDWVKDRSHLFYGVIEGTLIMDESYHFIHLGGGIERADNTARLLDGKYHVLLPSVADVGGAVDYYHWGAVLRAVSAFRAFHKVYSNVVTANRVAELLVLRDDMPRSLHACYNRITSHLDSLCGGRGYECQRMAGEIHARLHYGRMSEILEVGLHEFLTDFVERNTNAAAQIQRDFLMIT